MRFYAKHYIQDTENTVSGFRKLLLLGEREHLADYIVIMSVPFCTRDARVGTGKNHSTQNGASG